MSPLTLLLPLAIGLVALYMLRPRFVRRQVSVARFLSDLPPQDTRPIRVTPTAPVTSAPLYLQMLVLALVGAALWSEQQRLGAADRVLGVWLWLDSSYSMTTAQDGSTRIDRARQEALDAIRQTAAAASARVCFRVSSFDVERRDRYEGDAVDAARTAVSAITPRPAGTDLGLLRALKDPSLDPRREAACLITHAIVVTDRPVAPMPEAGPIVIWRDISAPVPNTAITAVMVPDDPFTPDVQPVAIDIESWPAAAADVTVTGPNGEPVALDVVPSGQQPPGTQLAQAQRTERVMVLTGEPGQYHVRIVPGGAYDGDDWVAFTVRPRVRVRVDWRLPDRTLLHALGWEPAVTAPQIRVTDRIDGATDDVPTLLVGMGFAAHRSGKIALFNMSHPLLEGVDLDLAERAGMAGLPTPAGFSACLRGDAPDSTYCAVRESPRAVYVPGLPTTRGDAVDVVSARLFFNALRWLSIRQDGRRPWHLLTPTGETIIGAMDEGPDQHEPRSSGQVVDLTPVRTAVVDPTPRWPPWVLAAALVFVSERLLAMYGGVRWR